MSINKKLKKLYDAHEVYLEKKDFKSALKTSLQAAKLAPHNFEILNAVAYSALYDEQWDTVIAYSHKMLQVKPDSFIAYDALAHAYGKLNRLEKCGEAGLKALTLRHQLFLDKANLPELPPNNPQGTKNIISFSLFGDKAEYIEPAVINTEIVNQIYPNWICRFYVDDSVPEKAIERLKNNGAEIIYADEKMQKMPKTIWRFLALADAEVARVIFRDADSVISQREAKAVQQWIESGKRFHTIRDSFSHTELILAGLWGAVGGSIPQLVEKIEAYVASEEMDPRFADQYFLRKCIWQYCAQDVFATDYFFHFGEAHLFPDDDPENRTALRPKVGDSEYHYVNAKGKFSGKTKVIWKLFSRVSPLLNEDDSLNYLDQERLVCQYEILNPRDEIRFAIPRRYKLGVDEGHTRLEITSE